MDEGVEAHEMSSHCAVPGTKRVMAMGNAMNILILGSGGREHAIADALANSPRARTVVVAPGNAGTSGIAENVALNVLDPGAVVAMATHLDAGLVVIGPEAPLAAGVSDALTASGFRVFGPSMSAARLETSKSFAREVCDAAHIPTARWRRFETVESALQHLDATEIPIVVKADGLAAGKGVVVAHDRADAREAVQSFLGGRFGKASSVILIESFLAGEEASFFALCDGDRALPLAGAEDYKRARDGDEGPNTGGMGSCSPTAILSPQVQGRTMDRIVLPCLREMARRGAPYRGVLYAGLMIRDGEPFVVEFNARFGDPECQALLARLQSDLLDLLEPAADGEVGAVQPRWEAGSALTVVMAAPGYPGAPELGSEIRGIEAASRLSGIKVHHAGTVREGSRLLAAGGRVLNVTGVGRDLADARARAYRGAKAIDWPEGWFRRDIGLRSLHRLGASTEL